MINEHMMDLGSRRSTIRELFEYGNRRAAIVGRENVFDFSIGNPNVPAPEAVRQAIYAEAAGDPVALHGYTSAQGAADVRGALADSLNKRFGTDYTGDSLYLTAGAAAALSCAFKAIVCEGDEIVGVLHIKDILMKPVDHEHFQVKDYMRDAYFVYEFNHISDVFASMRKEHVSLSVVLDEYGVMAGIVTLEDIVEEIVGEIDDEYDDNSEEVKKISKNVYLVDGSLNIDEVNDRCGTEFASEEFESIGGLVLGQVNGSPNPHQKVYVDGCMFIIEKIDKNRIELLRLIIPEEESQKENEEKHD